jgi:hypothetical protein
MAAFFRELNTYSRKLAHSLPKVIAGRQQHFCNTFRETVYLSLPRDAMKGDSKLELISC